MKTIILCLIIALAPTTVLGKTKTKLKTDFKFDTHAVRGNYQSNDQAVATVENEKTLNKMLQPRKNFKDRVKSEMKLVQPQVLSKKAK